MAGDHGFAPDNGGFPPDELDEAGFREMMRPLFEDAPRFIARLTEGRPYGSWEELFRRGTMLALDMPQEEQLELMDAHPRIGAPPASVSSHSFVEQGYDREQTTSEAESERQRIQTDLDRLNAAYETHNGFRYVIFVAGRPRSAIVPLLEAALVADRDAERERALRDVLAIARYRAIATGLMAVDPVEPGTSPSEEVA